MFATLQKHWYITVLITVQLRITHVRSFDPDSYRPYSWDSQLTAYAEHFDHTPEVPCPEEKPISFCICINNLRKSMYLVDCSFRDNMVPRYYYQLPHNTTHLIIKSHTAFKNLPNRSFANLTQLIHLDLSRNKIRTIERQAFECLTNLVALDLSDNDLQTIGNHAFECLINLVFLDLTANNLNRPAVFLRPLSSLRTLSAEAMGIEHIASGISELKKLEHLAISTGVVRKEDVLLLQNTSVTYLLITDVQGIEQGAFSSWEALNSLELTCFNDYQNLGNLSGLQVERLYIRGVSSATTIDFHDFETPNLTALAIWNAGEELIHFTSISVHTLQWLDVSYNKISQINSPQAMQQLHYFNISHQTTKDSSCTDIEDFPLDSLIYLDFEGTKLCTSDPWSFMCLFSTKEFVNLRDTGMNQFFSDEYFYCHSHIVAIKHLDLRDNNIECIDSSNPILTQYNWSALNVLKLSNNRLRSDDSEDCWNIQRLRYMDFLKSFWNLTDLYLDQNFMKYDLPHDMLLNQTQLQSLHLSDMFLANITFEIGHLTDLKYLDLSYNKIQCLYTSTMRDINTIIGYTPGRGNKSTVFELNLSHNRLQCTCACLEFYQWMRKVQSHYITFTDFSTYHCTFDNGKTTDLSDLNLIIDILRSQCVSTDWSSVITMTTAIVTVYMFIFTVCTLFRFRHTFRYLWLKHRMHREYLERYILDPKYNFDAFVSCERTDAIWVKRNFLPNLENQQTGLKFCVAQRNFMVGATIIDNIVRSINQSRKVVCVISQNFLKSGWCKEELLMGHQESLSRGKNLLICIFMPDIIHNQLSDRFRFILNHVTCIKWPRDPVAQQVFWIMLQRALLDGQPNRNEV